MGRSWKNIYEQYVILHVFTYLQYLNQALKYLDYKQIYILYSFFWNNFFINCNEPKLLNFGRCSCRFMAPCLRGGFPWSGCYQRIAHQKANKAHQLLVICFSLDTCNGTWVTWALACFKIYLDNPAFLGSRVTSWPLFYPMIYTSEYT